MSFEFLNKDIIKEITEFLPPKNKANMIIYTESNIDDAIKKSMQYQREQENLKDKMWKLITNRLELGLMIKSYIELVHQGAFPLFTPGLLIQSIDEQDLEKIKILLTIEDNINIEVYRHSVRVGNLEIIKYLNESMKGTFNVYPHDIVDLCNKGRKDILAYIFQHTNIKVPIEGLFLEIESLEEKDTFKSYQTFLDWLNFFIENGLVLKNEGIIELFSEDGLIKFYSPELILLIARTPYFYEKLEEMDLYDLIELISYNFKLHIDFEKIGMMYITQSVIDIMELYFNLPIIKEFHSEVITTEDENGYTISMKLINYINMIRRKLKTLKH